MERKNITLEELLQRYAASFIKATLTNTYFGGADLTTANFRNAKNAYFLEAILKDTIMPDGGLQSS